MSRSSTSRTTSSTAPTDPSKGLSLLYFQYQADGTKKIVFPESLAEGNTYQVPEGVTPG